MDDKSIFVIRETIQRQSYPIAWTNNRKEAELKIDERIDVLVREHELDGSKAFVHRGNSRTSIFKQSVGFLYNGNMSNQQTLSLIEVPHASKMSAESENEKKEEPTIVEEKMYSPVFE